MLSASSQTLAARPDIWPEWVQGDDAMIRRQAAGLPQCLSCVPPACRRQRHADAASGHRRHPPARAQPQRTQASTRNRQPPGRLADPGRPAGAATRPRDRIRAGGHARPAGTGARLAGARGDGHGSLSRSAAPRCTSRAARHPPSSVSSDAAGALLGIEASARRRGHGDEQQGPSARPRRRRSPRETPGTSGVPRGWPARVQNGHWCSAEKLVSTPGCGGARPGRGRAGTRTGPGRWAGRCPRGNPVTDVPGLSPRSGQVTILAVRSPAGRGAARGPCRQHGDY
jgi:hypothetical protein